MWQGEGDVRELSVEECWEYLRSHQLGRLAISAGGEIDIFPVNYLAEPDSILIRTAPGTKLLELVIAQEVAFEIDGYTDDDAWSVVLKGPAHRLERRSEIDEADAEPLTPWIPTLKYEYVRITADSLSGRHFRRGPEPERY